MCKLRGLLWGAALCIGVLPASWVNAEKPDKGPRSDGRDAKQHDAADRNAPADNARRRVEDAKDRAQDAKENAARRTDEAKDEAARRAANARDEAARRTQDAQQNAARQRDPARQPEGQRHEARKPEIDNRDRQGDRDRDRSVVRDRRGPDFGAKVDMRDNRVHIGDVTRDSFAARAGLRQGDVILSIDGQRIDSQRAYDRYLYRARGPRVPIIVLRDNERYTLYYDSGVFVRDGRRFDDRVAAGGAWLGVSLDYDHPDRALLSGVEPNSPAARAGLRAGDTILSVNDAEVRSPDELTQLIGERNPGDRVDLRLAGESRDPIVVTLGERPVARGPAVNISPRGIDVDAGGVDVNVSPGGVNVDRNGYGRRGRR